MSHILFQKIFVKSTAFKHQCCCYSLIDLNFCLSSSLFFRLFFENSKLFQIITVPGVLFINLMINWALFVKSFIHRCIIKYDITKFNLYKILKTRFLVSLWYKYKFINVWKFVDQFDHIKLHKMSNKTKWNPMTSESENSDKIEKYFLIIEFKNLSHKNVMKVICSKFNDILFNVSSLLFCDVWKISNKSCLFKIFISNFSFFITTDFFYFWKKMIFRSTPSIWENSKWMKAFKYTKSNHLFHANL